MRANRFHHSTAKLAVPESGAVVEIDRDVLTLPEKHRKVVRNWDLEDLRSLLDKPLRGRHFGNGEKLFQTYPIRVGKSWGNLLFLHKSFLSRIKW